MKFKPYKLNESLKRLDSNAFITDNPYDIANLIRNKQKLYRIIYDKNIDMYIIGNGYEYTHPDLVELAIKNGYYADIDYLIKQCEDVVDYMDIARESDKLYMIICDSINEMDINNSFIQGAYNINQYSFGNIFVLDKSFMELELSKLLEKDLI